MGNSLASSVKAGVAYAAAVFAIGFLLGTARVLLLAPRFGATLAVSVEVPVILAASWYVSTFCMKRLADSSEVFTGILVGAVAFVALMILEVVSSVGLFHRSIGEYLVQLQSIPGAIGLAAQVCFGTFPLLNVVIRRRSEPSGHAPHYSPAAGPPVAVVL